MSTIFDVLKDKFSKDIKDIEDSIGSGQAKSYEDYREMCGLIRGLRYALRHVDDLSQANKDYDDE